MSGYERSDLTINLHCLQSCWAWFLIDGQGDIIASSKRTDFADAAEDARKAFDAALSGKLVELP